MLLFHIHQGPSKGCITILQWIIFLCWSPLVISAQSPVHIRQDALIKKYYDTSGNSGTYYVAGYKDKNYTHAKIVRRINDSIAIIKVENEKTTFSAINNPEKISPANNKWKLSSSLEEKEAALLDEKNKHYTFSISADDINALLSYLKITNVAFEVMSVFKDAQSAVIKCSAATLFQRCIPETGLLFADLYLVPQTDVIISGYNRNISYLNLVDYFMPAANGNGITVGIKEKSMDETDIDLQKRVQPSPLAVSEKDFHATTVATLAGGAGNSFYSGKGVAWKCNFFPSSFTNLFPDSNNILQQNNVTIQNHSYGTQIQSFYGAEAVSYDIQTAQNKELVHVFSSGNRGREAATTGSFANLAGYANVTGNFKMAKNVITVAAADTAGNVAAFSSAGPLYDGRLGPQITAVGPNGTSEAAAIVSGAVAILQQVYKDSNVQVVPPASLIKAILFNSSDDIGNKGIDYRSGFGLLNIYNAVNCLQQKKYDGSELQQSQVWTKNFSLPAQAANFKITLCWTDTAGLVNDNKALVNDLDLEVVDVKSGLVYKPWCLSLFPQVDSLQKLPVRKRDSLNTTEQVSIELPASGQYQVSIRARQVSTIHKQSFHIAYSWDTLNKFQFTHPVYIEEINRKGSSDLNIQWKTTPADTGAMGSLFVTFNDGQSWQLIGSDIKINRQSFRWLMPDTAVTAQLRMNCSFGNFYSVPFVIAPLTSINVDYLCNESLRLSWQKNALANAYQLYALGDSAFIKPLTIIKDTFIVLNRMVHPENIYAVQPLPANELQVARSIAVDVRNQGVNCYYKTLQATAAGDSIELTLELGFLNDADSIVFEKVTASGAFKKTLAKFSEMAGKFACTSFDNSPDQGMNYYRAKLWVGGRYLYSEIVYVMHNGKKFILLYPNPVTRGKKINFIVKETVGESVLQVVDITGRVMGNYPASSSGSITTAAWTPGVYFYMLISADGKLNAGKFIIQ